MGACISALSFTAFADDFPKPYDSEKSTTKALSPTEAAKGFRVPEGFKVSVFASEPDVQNPIAMTWDGRGRLWVAENYTYSERAMKFDMNLRDRVLIFTDDDGDGKPEKRTVFIDTVQRLSSVEVGRGGVWLMCPPRLLFVPDRNNDDVPDGPPEVVLEGFDVPAENYHNFANGLKWGPDGWLYGRCGASAPGKVRSPEAPLADAVPLAGGIWRYSPKTKVFEALCHGTTNPWGHDWTEFGEGFFVNSVNGHLWHLIPGAHYRRPHTISPNPLVYEPMEMHADHFHWDTGKDWVASRDVANSSDKFGGGHAHSGAMIYYGEQWPKSYRGQLLTLNLHGRRANVEKLDRTGSGYIGRREPDILQAKDEWFRGLDLNYGPDGSVFILDWSDTGECHESTGVHRNSGRIFKVNYGDAKPVPAPNMPKWTDRQLVDELRTPRNEWYARQSRNEFATRLNNPKPPSRLGFELCREMSRSKDPLQRLRGLFIVHLEGNVDYLLYRSFLSDPNEHVRAWAVRLLFDTFPHDTVLGNSLATKEDLHKGFFDSLIKMALADSSGLVRLTLASALQRLKVAHRAMLAYALATRSEDAHDPNIQSLIWYGLIPVALEDPAALLPLALEGKLPKVREWIARRYAEVYAKKPGLVDGLLEWSSDQSDAVRRDVIIGLSAGFVGQRKAAAPENWKSYPKRFAGTEGVKLRGTVQALEVLFGDGRALDEVRTLALNDKADLIHRKAALETLIDADDPGLRAVCEKLLKVRFLNAVAVRGLTRFDDPVIGETLAKSYRSFHPSERPAVIAALVSRASFAKPLIDEIAKGNVARADLSAAQARQIRSLNDPAVTKKLAEVWGEVRDTPKDRTDLIAKWKADLTPASLKAADKSNGRAVFAKTCANCHRLYGSGGEIGPDLTGAGRKDIDYLLGNIIDPSAEVNKDFQITTFKLLDGRVLNGVVVAETEQTLAVQTADARLTFPKGDVDGRVKSPLSLMPDGLLQPLTPDQVRDLIAYLMSDGQVDLPGAKP